MATNSKIYILDHYYSLDHEEYCLIVECEKSIKEMIELTSSIEFLFEDVAGESECMDELCLLKILKEFYGMKDVKEKYKSILHTFMLSWNQEVINRIGTAFMGFYNNICLIDLYQARESCCGPEYKKLMEKYLSKGGELEKMKNIIQICCNGSRGNKT